MRFSTVCCNQSLDFNVGHIQLGIASIGARFAGTYPPIPTSTIRALSTSDGAHERSL